MKLTEKHIDKLSKLILDEVKKNEFVSIVSKEHAVLATIKEVFIQNMRDEELLNLEVKKLMAAYAPQIERGDVDSGKAFTMIKAKLAKEKGFTL